MDQLKRQVAQARRRLLLQQFLRVLPWCMSATLLIAVIALAVPKVWPLPIDGTLWLYSWLGGALGAGLLSAALWTWWKGRGSLDAAIEIDRRFGLKERVSSTLALSSDELKTEVGQALVADAVRRVERLDVRERFTVAVAWRSLLPMAAAVVMFLLVLLLDDAQREDARAAARSTAEARKQIKTSTAALKKKIAEQKKQAEAKGLEDAEALLKELERGVDQLNSQNDINRQKALIKINELAKELEKRREELGGSEQMKKQLDRLKDLQQGPADRVSKAMQEGNFKKALDELQTLKQKLEKGELSKEEQQQLAEQLEQMQKKLQEAVEAHEQAMRELEDRIKQLEEAGDRAAAARLQQQLDQMKQQKPQMDRLSKMASQLGQSAQSLRDGDGQQAANQLGQLSSQLEQMQTELDELQTLDQVMDQIADAKQAMNCQECDGEGCMACQNFGMGSGFSEGPPGFGLGEGQGQGERPEERTDTNYYESRVSANPKPGEAVRTGDADGPNMAGRSQQEVRQEIQSALSRPSHPLTDQRLPRDQREHARQYFEQFQQDR